MKIGETRGTTKVVTFNTYGKLFIVKRDWAEQRIKNIGYDSLAEFKSMYTYDDTKDWIDKAREQDALISVQKW